MIEYILNNRLKYAELVGQHLALTMAAIFLCFLIGIPVGALCFKNRALDSAVTRVAGSLRVVPSIATMLILMPIMGTGFLPALAALVILCLPPVIINTARSLESTDRAIVEAAVACGMNSGRVFRMIRLPLAMPMIITGRRISGLSVSAGAILAAYIGAGGLGELILSGMSQYRADILLAGALTTMVISRSLEGFFQILYCFSTRYRK